ncbi:MAG: HAD family hydrolase [Victivallales bacterium]|nr:HAD family hydrolase [Victivallales bacterium]
MDKHPFVFIDRDDTLIYDHPYLNTPDGVELTPGAGTALKELRQLGFRVIMLTNQSGIGRGLVTLPQLEAIHARLREMLQQEGAELDAIYFCPHRPEDGCDCRKPATGMLRQACRDFAIDVAHSAMIGDRIADIQMGRSFGLTTVQLRLTGSSQADHGADLCVSTLPEAVPFLAQLICRPSIVQE